MVGCLVWCLYGRICDWEMEEMKRTRELDHIWVGEYLSDNNTWFPLIAYHSRSFARNSLGIFKKIYRTRVRCYVPRIHSVREDD